MKIQRESMKLFYKGGYIHTSLCTQGSRTVFRGAGQLLAELRVGSVKCVGLLSVDYAGSVLGVAQERKREQYAYTTYGHCSSLPSGHSLLGFNGEHLDDLSQGYLLGNGYRLYKTMRFNSPDSFAPFRVVNAYGYCNGDPINYTDSSGHMRKNWFQRYASSNRTLGVVRKVIASFEAEIDASYHPIMGDPRELKSTYRTKLQDTKRKVSLELSYIDETIGNHSRGFGRLIKKRNELSQHANEVYSNFDSKMKSKFEGALEKYEEWSKVDEQRKIITDRNILLEKQAVALEEESQSALDQFLRANNIWHRLQYSNEMSYLRRQVVEFRSGITPLSEYPQYPKYPK